MLTRSAAYPATRASDREILRSAWKSKKLDSSVLSLTTGLTSR